MFRTAMDDPYATMAENSDLWTMDRQLRPKMEYPDIYNYLINTPSPYTKEKLKHTRVWKAISISLMAGLA